MSLPTLISLDQSAHKRHLDFTPTVGLGCRSGGYIVYIIIALGLLVIEMLVWWLTHETTHTANDLFSRVSTRLERHLSRGGDQEKMTTTRAKARRLLLWCTSITFRDVIRNFVIRPGEIINTGWLTYIIFAQTFGPYTQSSSSFQNLI